MLKADIKKKYDAQEWKIMKAKSALKTVTLKPERSLLRMRTQTEALGMAGFQTAKEHLKHEKVNPKPTGLDIPVHELIRQHSLQ